MKNFIYLLIIGGAFFGCGQKDSGQGEKEVVTLQERESFTEADLIGTFSGNVPCADCQGIAMTLTLQPDQTYRLQEEYQGGGAKQVQTQGTWTLREKGKRVQLLQTGAQESHKFDVLDEGKLRLYLPADEKVEDSPHTYELSRVDPAAANAVE